MKKLHSFNQDLLTIALFTFVTIAAWIAFDVYHAVVTSQITEVQQQLILELNPDISDQVIAEIQSRQQ